MHNFNRLNSFRLKLATIGAYVFGVQDLLASSAVVMLRSQSQIRLLVTYQMRVGTPISEVAKTLSGLEMKINKLVKPGFLTRNMTANGVMICQLGLVLSI